MDSSRLAGYIRLTREHPIETSDRARARIELALTKKLLARGRRVAYEVTPEWNRCFHELQGAGWPCEDAEGFNALWRELKSELPGFPRGHDADPAFARATWCATLHSKPEFLIETGVARGVTSRMMLEAMARNRRGHLWSVDLPPMMTDWNTSLAVAVPQGALRSRWKYVRGASRRRLPQIVDVLGSIDVFVHDSIHTPSNVKFELDLAWRMLRPGGLLLVNGIDRSTAFRRFLRRSSPANWLICQLDGERGEVVPGQFGVLVKRT
jgi:hypothetical protein